MLLNMERLVGLLDVEVPLAELSDMEPKPESPNKREESAASLKDTLEENPRGLGRKILDGDLVTGAFWTGLTPKIDFRALLGWSIEERLGFRGVDVDWFVVLMAILALNILGISGLRGVGFSFILLL